MENEIKWNEPIDDAEFESGLVSRLANRPNAQSSYGQGGLSASALKAWFDKSAMMLKDKLNALISALGSTDALDNILVTVEEGKEPISAKEWIESILNIEIDGEDKTIHDWLEQLSAFVNALNEGLAKKQDNIGLVVSNNEICMIIQEDE